MVDKSKSFEVDEGILLTDANGNEQFFLTGGISSPVGLDLSTNTIYVQNLASGVIFWQKFDTGVNDWRKYPASEISFDPSLVEQTNTSLQVLLENLANQHFGKDYTEQEKENDEQTTGGAFDEYDSMIFNVSQPTGINQYRVACNFYWNHNSASNDIRVRLLVDGAVVKEMRVEPKDPNADQRNDGYILGKAVNLSQGNHTLSIEYRPATASRVSRMYRSTLEVWRTK